MDPSHTKTRPPGRLAAAGMSAVLILSVMGPAGAHRPDRFWQYEKPVSKHRSWWNHRWIRERHTAWHVKHPTYAKRAHRRFHRRSIRLAHLRRHHFHRAVASQSGTAAWYNYSGQMGACGRVLRGIYAAHRTWPCGTLVSVRRGNRYVHVQVLDRGPFVSGWIIDLSPAAFKQVAPLGAGLIQVRAYRLKS
jgi:rare lipoprotein A (peptidoglycan hydrolase)